MARAAIRNPRPARPVGDWRSALARTLRRIGAAIVLLLLATGLALWWAARWTPDRAIYPTQGVTIDAGNGDVQWGSIKAAGADFAYVMGTDGTRGIDAKFTRNMVAAREAGVQTGAIHRYSLCPVSYTHLTLPTNREV